MDIEQEIHKIAKPNSIMYQSIEIKLLSLFALQYN